MNGNFASMIFCGVLALVFLAGFTGGCSDGVQISEKWQKVQDIKQQCMQSAAKNAIAQQKTSFFEPVDLSASLKTAKAHGDVKFVSSADGDLLINVTAKPSWYRFGSEIPDSVSVDLGRKLDMAASHSGIAVIVSVDDSDSSDEVRMGLRLHGDGGITEVYPNIPLVSKWDENTHQLYFDWCFLNYKKPSDAIDILKNVSEIEFTFGCHKREPQRGPSDGSKSAKITIKDVRLVDFLTGSYDPDRHDWSRGKKDLMLQHRSQEVTALVCRYGGEQGVKSAISSLDMAVRTQNWDGSFYEMRRGPISICVGEYTFGFTLHGLVGAYATLVEMDHPALAETITAGPVTMTRDEFYQRMLYRGAMARTAALPRDYRNDLIGGDTLSAGANRVLGYAIAMKDVAKWIKDDIKRREILSAAEPIMAQVADAQGRYSGGFNILAEGNRYEGKGIHYDSGYTRTHMDWLVIGVRRTGDEHLVSMLDKYQQVFTACMDSTGTGIMPMLSERHPSRHISRLVLPDITYQIGMENQLPVIAQWGYNVSRRGWSDKPSNHFTHAARAKGYSLGAHCDILVDDMIVLPEPKDTGYRFPRQMPVWSSYMYEKGGNLAFISRTIVNADGEVSNDYKVEVGQYPETVGVPVEIKTSGGTVKAQAISLTGWPALLADDAKFTLSGDVEGEILLGEELELSLSGPTRVVYIGPDMTLPEVAKSKRLIFRAELLLEPEKAGQKVTLKLVNDF